jgi:hypothetical protein
LCIALLCQSCQPARWFGCWFAAVASCTSEKNIRFLPFAAERKTLKNRVHLDLEPDQPRDQEVERIAALGATIVDDRRKPNGRGWVVIADPAGNEFYVEVSAAEMGLLDGHRVTLSVDCDRRM